MSDEAKVLFEGRHVRLMARGRWEYVQRRKVSGIVGIVAIVDGKIVLVEQERPPLNRRVIELPAGLAGDLAESPDETLADAAKRELFEETGYEAARMRPLMAGVTSAGITDEVITLCLAEGVRKTGAGGEGSERITVHEVVMGELMAWITARIAEGALVDFKIFAGIYLAWANGAIKELKP